MVACATPVLGGSRRPSLARPMLDGANLGYLAGRHVEAAARLREALRRDLAACCLLYCLDSDGPAETLVGQLTAASVPVCCFYSELLFECDDVITLKVAGKHIGPSIEVAFTLNGMDTQTVGTWTNSLTPASPRVCLSGSGSRAEPITPPAGRNKQGQWLRT